MIEISRDYPVTLAVDGQELRVRVARMTVNQATRFERQWARLNTPDSERLVSTRMPGEEMEKRPVVRPRSIPEIYAAALLERATEGERTPFEQELVAALRALVPEESTEEEFVLPLDVIQARRRAEMTPERRAAWQRLVDEEDAAVDGFTQSAIQDYLTVEPGQLVERLADGTTRSLTSGADFLQAFAARGEILHLAIAAVRAENFLPEARKNALRSLFASTTSSPEPSPAAPGSGPAPTAAAVEPKASATSVAATVSSEMPAPADRSDAAGPRESSGAIES